MPEEPDLSPEDEVAIDEVWDEQGTILLALLNRAEQGGDDLEEDLNLILRELPRSGDVDPKVKPSPFRDRKKL